MGRRRPVATGLAAGVVVGYVAALLRARPDWERDCEPRVSPTTLPGRQHVPVDLRGAEMVDLTHAGAGARPGV